MILELSTPQTLVLNLPSFYFTQCLLCYVVLEGIF